MTQAGHVELHLLGRFAVLRDGVEVPPSAFGGRKVRGLLKVLATRQGSFVSNDVLAEALWPDRPPSDPVANLQVLVNRARRALGDPALITTGAGGYTLSRSCVVDGERVLGASSPGEALAHWHGDPLPEEAYDAWAEDYRERLLRAHQRALEDAAGRLWSDGFFDDLARLDSGTLSLWRDTAAATAFAYGPGVHQDAVKSQRDEGWFSESWFARFAIEAARGKMTTGALIACAIIAGRVNGPLVTQLPNFIVQWGYARASLRMLDNILQLPMDDDPDVQGLRPTQLGGALKLEGARFAYPGAREGLDIAKLEIGEGERVAIVGGIGSGKTTMLRLMAGLYRPQAGRVMVGNLDAAQIAPDLLRQHVGYLAQDYRLVNGTLRENLLLGLSNPGDDAVMKVVQQSGLIQLVNAHPRGLDLPIAEGGRGLSGGQRTLVGLTRLLLARPKVLLLDEPTANLDDQAEGAALGAIASQLAASSTLVVVTHKLRLLSLVNRVVVMMNGRIVLDGPTGEVVKALQGAPREPQKVEASA